MARLPDETKQCTKCGEVKALSEFHKKSAAKDGLQTRCKQCWVKYNIDHKEQILTRGLAWKKANPEKVYARNSAWQKANPEKASARSVAWAKANPEKSTAKWHRRRARKLSAEGSYTGKNVKELYESQGGQCVYCGRDISQGYHVDHVVPLSRGGSNGPENLALACPKCNCSKNDHLLSEWVDRPPCVE